MGLDYAIDLYFAIEQLEQALIETAKIADPDRDPREVTSIKLLDGKEIIVPFTTKFKPGHLELKNANGEFELDTTFLFPLDDALLDFINPAPGEPLEAYLIDVDGEKFVYVGYIYLTLHISYRYIRLHFVAATTSMSRLFEASRSVHKRFLEVLSAARGVVGLIDIESNEYPLLVDPQQKIYFDQKDYLVNDGEEYYANGYVDVDRLTEAILQLVPKID